MSFNLRPTMIASLLFTCLIWLLAGCGTSTMPSGSSLPSGPHGAEVPVENDADEATNNDANPATDEEVVDETQDPAPDETDNGDDIPSDPVPDDTDNNDEEPEDDTTESPGGNQTIPADTTPAEDEEEEEEETSEPVDGVLCTGNIVIDSPDDLQYYENCTEIAGSLTIDCPELTDFNFAYLVRIQDNLTVQNSNSLFTMSGFGVLNHVGGDITITNNPGMIYIGGLSQLTSVGGSLIINNNINLAELTGLDALVAVDGGRLEIAGNTNLLNLNHLSSLQSISGSLIIRENARVNAVLGLANLSSIGAGENGGSLEIYKNESLKDLNGLENLIEMPGTVHIYDNANLICTYALRNLTHVTQDLIITGNPILSWCEVDILVDALTAANGVDGEIISWGNLETEDCDLNPYHSEDTDTPI